MQAMILAAGLGTRLLPHTRVCPKPLFPILNQPLLLLTIKRLQNHGFDSILVNCHHLGDQIVSLVDSLSGVTVLHEDKILGTGGGLRGGLEHMRDEPLLVTNGDIYHTVDFRALYNHHQQNDSVVTLAMHDHHRFNNVMIRDGKVASFDNRVEFTQLAFTGLHVIDPEILEDVEKNRNSCIIDFYRKLLERGESIDCYRVDDCFWTDMGTVDDYLDLHRGLLKDDIPCWAEIGEVRKPYCIDMAAKLPAHIVLEDWVCIGGAHIEDGSHLERVVVWNNVRVAAGSRLVDTVISDGTS
ncbi:hypothetical protein DGMP_12310 [Desulfomarina profundi]|uniref:Nucleotidyl transferase domain-containing protein n=1 Tax=Desulfomarina profundi TaxID=2772557 RepID=A0A8D5FFT9_9BACT|nr:sugar phosphate nucleotidyltransferase [Desulfomarina profundi]BCL60538.1 hypothetical protein DGMP_12310 [Desulfomarina profundi]